jgi:hypothetical protein
MKKNLLDTIDVKQPCPESWDEMTGNDLVRFCSHCSKDVHNLSSMTRARAEKLVRDSNGRLCVRYVRALRGGVVTAPARLTQIKRQASVAAGVLAASLTLSTLAYSQSESARPAVNEKVVVKLIPRKTPNTKGSVAVFGVVLDVHGAVVPGARVTLTLSDTERHKLTTSNSEGRFEFEELEPGSYDFEVISPGFQQIVMKGISIKDDMELTTELQVNLDAVVVGLLVVDLDPVQSESPQISGELQIRPKAQMPAELDGHNKSQNKKNKKKLPK